MTAEIAILNRNAVALAADSAVTLQTGNEAPKIYNTNKLFTLSKYQPVGVMIYGNAEFMDVPWEIAVKAYRDNLGKKTFGAVSGYGNDFLKFIEENTAFFPGERQKSHVYDFIASWFHLLKHRLSRKVGPELEKEGISKRRLQTAFRELVDEQLKDLHKRKTLPQFIRKSTGSILRQYRDVIHAAIEDELKELAVGTTIRALEACAANLLIKDVFWENATGVVIADFGTNQFFPSMRAYEFSPIVAGRLRSREERKADVTFDDTAIIHAFAQSEMVIQFMDGIDRDYREFITYFTQVALLDIYPKIISKLLTPTLSPTQMKRIQNKFIAGGRKVVEALVDEMVNYSRKWHSNPVINICARTS